MKAKCMQCGGSTKMKKMKTGGSMGIVGMPKYSNDPRTDAGRTLKKGGAIKKYQDGGQTIPGIIKKDRREIMRTPSGKAGVIISTLGSAGIGAKMIADKIKSKKAEKKEAEKVVKTLDKAKVMKMGGSSFGMLSVKAGVDKNPNPTAADRIAGAKMKKAKFGASVKVQHSPDPGRVRSSSGTGTVPVGMRKKTGGEMPKAQYGKIVKTAAKYISPAMGAAKSATKSAKIGVKQLSDKYKKAKVDSYNKKTANLKRSEDWEKFEAAESDKKLQRALIGIAGGSTALALYPNKKKSKKK